MKLKRLRLPLVCAVLFAACAVAAQASEFFIRVESPSGWKNGGPKKPALVVRAYADGEATSARLTARAEGMVDGKRQSIELKTVPVANGIYAIEQQWPAKGDWIVAVSGRQQGITCSKIVELGPDGTIPENQRTCLCGKCFPWRQELGLKFNGERKLNVQTFFRALTAKDLASALERLTYIDADNH